MREKRLFRLINTKRVRTFVLTLFMLLCCLLSGCTSSQGREYKEATKEIEKKNFRTGLSILERVIARDPETEWGVKATREAARISYYEVKDYEKAAKFYKGIVLYSKDPEERISAQKSISTIYFDHLNDYPKSVGELSRLVTMLAKPEDQVEYKLKLARAYYYQNNFSQAENEADEFLRTAKDPSLIFDMLMLKGNINVAQKNLGKAAEVFKRVLKEFPNIAKKENVVITLAVCYEEMKDYKSAVKVLEEALPTAAQKDIVEFRLKRLKQRQMNQPGARGFRK